MPYFAMQGSAYLLPFYQGVVQGLADAGALGEATHLAGLSGGALTAALVAAGVSGEAQFNATTAMIKACGAAGPAGCQPLNGKLAGLLGDLLPPDAGARAGARVRVWVSALPDTNATTLAGSVPYGVSDFASTPDLTAALFASDMIPCFSDGDRAYNLVRGVPAIDGGFSSDFRELCADVAGAGLTHTETTHRIDIAQVKADMAAAGFKFVGESNVLRNKADPRDKLVFDKSIRGKTDQFIYVFRKP